MFTQLNTLSKQCDYTRSFLQIGIDSDELDRKMSKLSHILFMLHDQPSLLTRDRKAYLIEEGVPQSVLAAIEGLYPRLKGGLSPIVVFFGAMVAMLGAGYAFERGIAPHLDCLLGVNTGAELVEVLSALFEAHAKTDNLIQRLVENLKIDISNQIVFSNELIMARLRQGFIEFSRQNREIIACLEDIQENFLMIPKIREARARGDALSSITDERHFRRVLNDQMSQIPVDSAYLWGSNGEYIRTWLNATKSASSPFFAVLQYIRLTEARQVHYATEKLWYLLNGRDFTARQQEYDRYAKIAQRVMKEVGLERLLCPKYGTNIYLSMQQLSNFHQLMMRMRVMNTPPDYPNPKLPSGIFSSECTSYFTNWLIHTEDGKLLQEVDAHMWNVGFTEGNEFICRELCRIFPLVKHQYPIGMRAIGNAFAQTDQCIVV